MSWALVILVYVTLGDGVGRPPTGGPAMTTVPGFTTAEACTRAAAEFRNSNSGAARVFTYCIPVR